MLGDKLRLTRVKKKMTQQQLADFLKINRVTYAQYELNKRDPDTGTLKKIADFFNVSTDYLLGRNEISSNLGQAEISPEDIELLRQIKKASAEKQKAIELILNLKEQSAAVDE